MDKESGEVTRAYTSNGEAAEEKQNGDFEGKQKVGVFRTEFFF